MAETDIRCFFSGTEIPPTMAEEMENHGHIHVTQGASGGRPSSPEYKDFPEGPWTLFKPGPGNNWIEKQEGTCHWCRKPWAEHLRPIWVRKDKEHTCPHAPQPKEVLP